MRPYGCLRKLTMVRSRGLEPPRDFSHKHLKLARLPVPPRPHGAGRRRLGCVPAARGIPNRPYGRKGQAVTNPVEWRISDSPVPYPEAVQAMEARVAAIRAGT